MGVWVNSTPIHPYTYTRRWEPRPGRYGPQERCMAKHGKRYNETARGLDPETLYDVTEAIEMAKKTATAKFPETVDVAIRLGVDPRHGDQMVRGTTNLPHGTGKVRRVAVFAK